MLTRPPLNARRASGFTLLEVLIAVVVLSIGLLGLAGLQLSGLKASQDAYVRSQATVLAQDIIERMRANRGAALDGEYDTGMDDQASGYTGGTVAQNDLSQWKTSVEDLLPQGQASVQVDGTSNVATVQLRWQERAVENSGGTAPITFSTDTQL